jgi:peptidoglycan hydrolase-like protein with peptidoglycan-binding domain
MVKKICGLGLAVVGIFVLSGCAMMNKNDALSNQGLRNKVSVLEAQLKEKDDEINSLKDASAKSSEELNLNISKVSGAILQAEPKQIQTALKNSGYYQGAVDGKLGKKTRKAVREFQKANNLPVDGRVGKNTWEVLKQYLEKKVK